MREVMLVFCLRCGGFYDMDMEEGWSDHHPQLGVQGNPECLPASGCDWVTDQAGRYCRADHTGDWKIVVDPVRTPD